MLLNQITVRKSPACREGSTNGKNYSEEVFTTTLAVSHHHDNYSWSARVPTISSWLDSSSRNAVRSFILQPQHNMTRGLAPPHQKVWSITRVKARRSRLFRRSTSKQQRVLTSLFALHCGDSLIRCRCSWTDRHLRHIPPYKKPFH